MNVTEHYFDDIKQKIAGYDLSAIIERLVLIEGWSLQHAQEIVSQYRNFLKTPQNLESEVYSAF